MQFEYKTLLINGKDVDNVNDSITEKLNTYGKDEWELVSSLTQPCLGSSQYSLLGITQKYILILKRRLGNRRDAEE